MLKVVEAFSGIGSQNKALKNIEGLDFKIINTIEWDINAIHAYDLIHNGKQDYSLFEHITDDEIFRFLDSKDLSFDGKEPITTAQLLRMSYDSRRSLYISIIRTNNLISIKNVKALDFKEDIDIFTYSFPCQDLSVSGFFHGDKGGIERGANNSSSMLWEVERILLEFIEEKKILPKFLLMENVSSITSKRHLQHFNEWKNNLVKMGYVNEHFKLNSSNFGIPQKRVRTFMISTFVGQDDTLRKKVNKIYKENNLESFKTEEDNLLNYLRRDYSNDKYLNEAIEQVPNYTESRIKIHENNPMIVDLKDKLSDKSVRTLTTKQDRHPNSGIIEVDIKEMGLSDKKAPFRYLTPRESFLLMGFEERDFDTLIENNLNLASNRILFTKSKLTKLAGNSIVVPVIEQVFRKILKINSVLEEEEDNR